MHLLVLKKETLHYFGEYTIVNWHRLSSHNVCITVLCFYPHFCAEKECGVCVHKNFISLLWCLPQKRYTALSILGRNAQQVPGMSEALHISSTNKIKQTWYISWKIYILESSMNEARAKATPHSTVMTQMLQTGRWLKKSMWFFT